MRGSGCMRGEIPLWNPNVGLGAPVIGDGHTGVFYPTICFIMMMPAKWAWVCERHRADVGRWIWGGDVGG